MELPILTIKNRLQIPIFSKLLPNYIRIDQNTGDIIPEQEFYKEPSHRTKILVLLLGLKVKNLLGLLHEERVRKEEVELLCWKLEKLSTHRKINKVWVYDELERLINNEIVKKEGKRFWVPDGNLPNAEKLLREKLYGSPGLSADLRELYYELIDIAEKKYLNEIIICYGGGAFTATIILTWILSVDRLQNYILKHGKLGDFNLKLSQSYPKIEQVNDKADFSNLKESIFIEVLKSANIITKDVYKILVEKLNFRNSCAHPSDIVITKSKVTSFVEDLIHNVLLKYKI